MYILSTVGIFINTLYCFKNNRDLLPRNENGLDNFLITAQARCNIPLLMFNGTLEHGLHISKHMSTLRTLYMSTFYIVFL